MSVSEDSKAYVSATFFRIHPGKDNLPVAAVSTQCFNNFFFSLPKCFNKFNIKVDVITSYLSDTRVDMRKGKRMKSRSVMQEIKNRRPQKSFTFECRCLTRDLISKVISDENIPFSLDRIPWTDQNVQKVNWIPLKNSDDVIGRVLDITNPKEISPAVSDRKQKEFTLLLSIPKETIIPHHEFETMVRQTKELARDTSRMVSLMNSRQASFGRPLSHPTLESTILHPTRERGGSLGIFDSLESLADLAIIALGDQEGRKLVPALKWSVEAFQDTIAMCTICREHIGTGSSIKCLRCHHRFHKTCIEMWLARNHVCPLCTRATNN